MSISTIFVSFLSKIILSLHARSFVAQQNLLHDRLQHFTHLAGANRVLVVFDVDVLCDRLPLEAEERQTKHPRWGSTLKS